MTSNSSNQEEVLHLPLIRTNSSVAASHSADPTSKQRQHRSIDDFYAASHSTTSPIQRPVDVIRFLSQRLPYLMCFVSLGMTNVGDAAEMGSMRYLLANDGFLHDVVNGQEGVIISGLYVGMLAGGLLSGPLCDQLGRRNVLLSSLLLNSVAGVSCSFAMSTREIVMYRMGIGFGIGSISSCLVPLASEHSPPRLRGSYINFVNAFKTAGSIYVAVLALYMFGKFDKSWRLYLLVDAVPTLLSLVLVFLFCPESARYLALRGRHEEATLTANRLASSMGSKIGKPLTVDEMRTSHPATKLPTNASEWKSFSSIAFLYRNPLTRSRVLTLQALSFLISFGSGISLWIVRFMGKIAGIENIYIVGIIFSSACIPGVLIAGYVVDRVDRTVLLTTSLAGCSLTLFTLGLLANFSRAQDSSMVVVLMACLFHMSSVICTLALSLVTVESFSTSLRSTASGLCTACARIASIFVHFIIAILLSEDQNPPATFFISSACFFLAVLVSWADSLENRTGAPLPDFEPNSRNAAHNNHQSQGSSIEVVSKA
jgi:putative MFS transporter